MNSKMDNEYFQVNEIGLGDGQKRVIEAWSVMGCILQVYKGKGSHATREAYQEI